MGQAEDFAFFLGEDEAKFTCFNVDSAGNTNERVKGAPNVFAVVTFLGGVDIVKVNDVRLVLCIVLFASLRQQRKNRSFEHQSISSPLYPTRLLPFITFVSFTTKLRELAPHCGEVKWYIISMRQYLTEIIYYNIIKTFHLLYSNFWVIKTYPHRAPPLEL